MSIAEIAARHRCPNGTVKRRLSHGRDRIRTLLNRRYNSNRWAKRDAPPHNWGEEMTWEEDLPHTNRIVIDGVTYVHYYDKLTDAACGIVD